MCFASAVCVKYTTVECVLLLQNVFSYYRMCFASAVCVRAPANTCMKTDESTPQWNVFSYYRMCSLTMRTHEGNRREYTTVECVLLLQNVFSDCANTRMKQTRVHHSRPGEKRKKKRKEKEKKYHSDHGVKAAEGRKRVSVEVIHHEGLRHRQGLRDA